MSFTTKLDQIFPIMLDVTKYDEAYQSVADAVAHFGRNKFIVHQPTNGYSKNDWMTHIIC